MKASIVFEEGPPVANGISFKVYLDGVDFNRLATIPESQWSTAEFWAVKCFRIVQHLLKQSGAFSHVEKRDGG